jgi:hypothetical protein
MKTPREGERETFGFLTSDPNVVVAPIHPNAMPAVMTKCKRCFPRTLTSAAGHSESYHCNIDGNNAPIKDMYCFEVGGRNWAGSRMSNAGLRKGYSGHSCMSECRPSLGPLQALSTPSSVLVCSCRQAVSDRGFHGEQFCHSILSYGL